MRNRHRAACAGPPQLQVEGCAHLQVCLQDRVAAPGHLSTHGSSGLGCGGRPGPPPVDGEQGGGCSHGCKAGTDRGTWDSPPTLLPSGLSQGPYTLPHHPLCISALTLVPWLAVCPPDPTANPGTCPKCVAVYVSGFRTMPSMWEPRLQCDL